MIKQKCKLKKKLLLSERIDKGKYMPFIKYYYHCFIKYYLASA